MFKNVHIAGVGSYHPQNQIDNQYYIDHFKAYNASEHASALLHKLGREIRTLASEEETSLTMAVNAAKAALHNSGIRTEELDMIISVSDTPEYLSPCCALLIKNQIKAVNAHAVFDMNANCIGMLTAMDTAARYLKTDVKFNKVLIVGSLLISPQARKDDMVAYACTGDGAAAIILEKKEEATERGLLGSRMFTDDTYYWSITMPACGMSKISSETVSTDERKMLWKPFDFDFLSGKWSELITNLLADFRYTPKQVTQYFMSQFSKTDLELTMRQLNTDMSRAFYIGDKYGYTGCTSPIMALEDKLKTAHFNQDELVIFCSVASGYSMTALLYQW
ncbi:3-oxoacyl-[acyl-carrier-protein] synthase III C-terminal domain-containing protein [Anaerocolumna sp. AGMB13025]|uniref:3-oxoacyl-[acyl-carrier-protein] synthase III C-terminal domain-containing protein n=1 Tax=Anaerocolumna sp. AGMB13025 TaxID=3039116 RepID=UPI002420458F|nr:3-oxoacyl-[acyl-carrier-protein] synthase III C-terminal domain-containing protein [Anaerocolumna sp. AGMB13025]WFR56300.1 3-oxoacyl-[acyl-carrier-protein] synthase III C-terminal domain-containing protein [Anaerocolumna sp. AGMB13025]